MERLDGSWSKKWKERFQFPFCRFKSVSAIFLHGPTIWEEASRKPGTIAKGWVCLSCHLWYFPCFLSRQNFSAPHTSHPLSLVPSADALSSLVALKAIKHERLIYLRPNSQASLHTSPSSFLPQWVPVCPFLVLSNPIPFFLSQRPWYVSPISPSDHYFLPLFWILSLNIHICSNMLQFSVFLISFLSFYRWRKCFFPQSNFFPTSTLKAIHSISILLVVNVGILTWHVRYQLLKS